MDTNLGQLDSKLLTVYLQERLPSYFDDSQLGGASIQFINQWARPASIFFRFQVNTRDRQRFILTKVPLLRDGMIGQETIKGRSLRNRPRLASLTDPEEKYQLEHRALLTIQNYFDQINDPRFGVVRVLDFVDEHRALVMEELQDDQLSNLLAKENRAQSFVNATELSTPFSNAGAWLRTYHALPDQDQVQARHTDRAAFVNLLLEYTDFLEDVLGDRPFFRRIFAVAAENANKVLTGKLPLGLGHGDFAMRNILVNSENRVTVLDTLAKWRTPIYEDIAYFLVGLKMNKVQVLSQGAMFSSRRLNRYEQRFLDGYFGHPSSNDYSRIRLYELLILLDKWTSQITLINSRNEGAAQRIWGQSRLVLVNRYFRQRVHRLLETL